MEIKDGPFVMPNAENSAAMIDSELREAMGELREAMEKENAEARAEAEARAKAEAEAAARQGEKQEQEEKTERKSKKANARLHALNTQTTKRFRNKRGSIRIEDSAPERQLSEFNKAGADLLNSRTKNQPLTVRVDGVAPLEIKTKNSEGEDVIRSIMMPTCLYHGWHIIIPPSEFFAPSMLSPEERTDSNELLKRMIGCRGAEIDIIPMEFKPEEKMVLASRVRAMEVKRRQMWFATNERKGKTDYLIQNGSRVEARITSVVRGALFVDVFGAETGIRAENVTYQRLKNLRDEFKPGDRFFVIVKDIHRDPELGDVMFEASLKDAYPDPRRAAFEQYTVNGIYGGTVSFIQYDPNKAEKSGAFVRLNGIDCYCRYPDNKNPDIGDEVTIAVSGMDKNSLKMWGRIIHIEPGRRGELH